MALFKWRNASAASENETQNTGEAK